MVMTNFRDYEEDIFEAGILLSYGQHIQTAKRRKKASEEGDAIGETSYRQLLPSWAQTSKGNSEPWYSQWRAAAHSGVGRLS